MGVFLSQSLNLSSFKSKSRQRKWKASDRWRMKTQTRKQRKCIDKRNEQTKKFLSFNLFKIFKQKLKKWKTFSSFSVYFSFDFVGYSVDGFIFTIELTQTHFTFGSSSKSNSIRFDSYLYGSVKDNNKILKIRIYIRNWII